MKIIVNKTGASFLIFLGVTLFLYWATLNWGFAGDDCGMIYAPWKILKEQGILALFKAHDNFAFFGPSNCQTVTRGLSSFSVIPTFYRPLTLLFFAWQYEFFYGNPFGYLLIMIVFHALNTLLIFNIFSQLFRSIGWGSAGALFFGLHISLWGWMGWIAAQPYVISMTLLLISTMLFFSIILKLK